MVRRTGGPLFTTHAPATQQEFRNLYQKLRNLEQGGGSTSVTTVIDGGGGPSTVVPPGTVHTWQQDVSYVENHTQNGVEQSVEYQVAVVPGPYTHLGMVVASPFSEDFGAIQWEIRGKSQIYSMATVKEQAEEPGGEAGVPTFYDHARLFRFSTAGAGRFAPWARDFDDGAYPGPTSPPYEPDGGDLAYFSIVPDPGDPTYQGTDRLELRVNYTPSGIAQGTTAKFSAWIQGLYVVHDPAFLGIYNQSP